MKFHTVEKLGAKQSLTPEGFLICSDVPVARSGEMIYGPNETPITVGPNGVAKVRREEEDIFSPTYMASLEGKPVTDDHPPEDVDPDNLLKYFKGSMINVRRGVGMQGDMLIADLMIMDRATIQAVRDGKREVSLGYDADYVQLGPGVGKQTNLLGNHVALVEAGRCGNRCAIGDADTQQLTGVTNMAKKTTFLDRLMTSFGAASPEELITKMSNEENDDGAGGDTHVHIHNSTKDSSSESTGDATMDAFGSRLAAVEANAAETKDAINEIKGMLSKKATADESDPDAQEMEDDLADEAPKGTQDKARKARDSQYLGDSFQEAVAGAEILAPGIRFPVYDHAATASSTLDAICGLRRKALDIAYHSNDGKSIIDPLLGGKDLELSGMKCNAVRSLFRGAVAAKKAINNTAQSRDASSFSVQVTTPAIQTIADLNKRNRELYGNKEKASNAH